VLLADLEGFGRLLSNMQISLQPDVSLRLFDALTLNCSDGKLPVILIVCKLCLYISKISVSIIVYVCRPNGCSVCCKSCVYSLVKVNLLNKCQPVIVMWLT